MRFALLFLAAATLRFDVVDARGKKVSDVKIETSAPDADGWCQMTIAKSKKPAVIVWPFDGRAKAADGPEPIPVIVIEEGTQAFSQRAIATVWAGELLGVHHNVAPITTDLVSTDPFEMGVALLHKNKASDAVEPLARALRDRERQLTRIPSEIYAAAMLYGKALAGAGKYDDAAVAYLKALKQRPSDVAAHQARAAALIKAGKAEAAEN